MNRIRESATNSSLLGSPEYPLASSLEEKFAAILTRLLPAATSSPRLGLAVSGGSDSMALTLLTHQFNDQLLILTVDHQLRPESAQEAAQVGEWMRALGLEHRILPWQHAEITGNLQAAAREARYRLLTQVCREHAIDLLLVAHTEDDQAETIALRQQRESGPIGLAGMSAKRQLHDITLLRPLLTTSRQELREYLHTHRQPWIDDPSNDNSDFDRIRIRKELERYPERKTQLLTLGREMAAERQQAEIMVNRWIEKHVHCHSSTLRFALNALTEGNALNTQPKTLTTSQYLLLCRLLTHTGGDAYPPRFQQVVHLYRRIAAEESGKATLAHCLIRWQQGELIFSPESPALRAAHVSSVKALVVPPFYLI